jgi:hypothetical protein
MSSCTYRRFMARQTWPEFMKPQNMSCFPLAMLHLQWGKLERGLPWLRQLQCQRLCRQLRRLFLHCTGLVYLKFSSIRKYGTHSSSEALSLHSSSCATCKEVEILKLLTFLCKRAFCRSPFVSSARLRFVGYVHQPGTTEPLQI